MRRDRAEDNRYFDRISANRAAAPNSTKLADMMGALAETHEGKYAELMTIAGLAQDLADKGHDVSAYSALRAFEAALKVLGLVK